jgi:translation initiation factor IF-2
MTTDGGAQTAGRVRQSESREIEIPRTITVGELADRLGQDPVDIIKNLMRMGIMASVTQAVEFESVVPIAQFYGFEVTEGAPAHEASLGERMGQATGSDDANLEPRPPVVTVLGHVDHGKTSILDSIRKADVISGEAGGITQHIGAYQVSDNGRLVTFLDTPGHEAFTMLRARGAHVTDIAILVVDANDGVMPQTIEAITHAKAGDVPVVVAINKMDVPGADPERVKRQLSEQEVLVEDWGGDVVSVPVSAKTGDGLSQLLESVLLVAEISELKADPTTAARGTIIEARLEANRGPIATVLIQSGTLRTGSTVVVGATWGRVRALTDYQGERIQEALPSTPVEVLGLQDIPRSGDVLEQVGSEREARAIVAERVAAAKVAETQQLGSLEQLASQIGSGEVQDLNLIIKTDVHGSLEAIRSSLERLGTEETRVIILHGGVGSITEGDILLASASGATILGFNARVETAARRLADTRGVEIRNYTIIYQLIEDIQNTLTGLAAPLFQEIQEGAAEIRQVFEMRRSKIAGCVVTDGRIRRGSMTRVVRRGETVYEGPISSLRRFRDEVREVNSGQECGIGMEGFSEFEEGDLIQAFHREERRP